jgi:predicted permease
MAQSWLGALWQDVRYGARTMRRSQLFTGMSIGVLALGVGVNAALFSVVDSIFARDLGVAQPERLFFVQTKTPTGRVLAPVSLDDATFLRDAAKDVAEFSGHLNVIANVAVAGRRLRLDGEIVEGNYFDLLGVAAALGRTFRPGDNDLSAPDAAVVVSYGFWKDELGGDPNLLEHSIVINGRPYRVVGVGPPGFAGLSSAFRPSKWWVPNNTVAGGTWALGPIARLRPGVDSNTLLALVAAKTPELVRRDWEAMRGGASSVWPWDTYRQKAFPVANISTVEVPSSPDSQLVPRSVIAALATVSGLVLLIACANVAGLLLARGTVRAGEIALRRALGAGGLRLFRQLLTEALLLAGAGAFLGMGLAAGLVRLFASLTASTIPVPIRIDWRMMLFAASVGVVAGILVGLTPAIQATRVRLLEALGSGVVGSRGTGPSLVRWIVFPQVAVSLVLLLVAGVHVRSLWTLEGRALGYSTRGTTAFQIDRASLGQSLWQRGSIQVAPDEDAKQRAFWNHLSTVMSSASTVSNFAVVSELPLGGFMEAEKPVVERPATMQASANVSAVKVFVSDNYFNVMGMRLLAGRAFDARDGDLGKPSARVAIVSASVAKALGGDNLVGRSIALSDGRGQPDWAEVIGVVNDVSPVLDDGRLHSVIYEAMRQQILPSAGTLLVHGGQGDVIHSVAAAIGSVDPTAEVVRIRTLDEIVGELLYPRRLAAAILAGAAGIALALACIGLYGVVSYSAAQRTREYGIRSTLGATRQDIIRLVLKDAGVAVGSGVGVGLVLGLIALQAAAKVTPGLPVFDAVVILGVPFILVCTVLAACLPPAMRAARVQPAKVIRGD